MQAITTARRQRSLVAGLRNGLIGPISLLLIGLVIGVCAGIFSSISQYNLGEQKVVIRGNVDGMLRSMVDQETGLRGYISTNNLTFLEPFNSGRPQYVSSLQQLETAANNNASFNNTTPLILAVDNRASDWYNNYALVQVRNVEAGDLATARSESTNAAGKAAFDAFRTALTQLQAVINTDVTNLQAQVNTINIVSVVLGVVISLFAIFALYRAFNDLTSNLHGQLEILQNTTAQLGSGNLAARVPALPYTELGQLTPWRRGCKTSKTLCRNATSWRVCRN